MLVRILNTEGIRLLSEYLGRVRAGETLPVPTDLLTDSATSEPLAGEVGIEQVAFASKFQAAKYISERFAGRRDVDHNVGLWSWLALYYFDQLCPGDESGGRRVREDARYIPGTTWRRYYRHLLAAPYRVYRNHIENARLLLLDPVDKLGDIWEQLASRQEIISNQPIVGAATLLYLDSDKDRPKRGAASTKRKPGTLRRFVDLIQQLDLTYDLYSMQPTDILGLLPAEFDGWRPPSPASQTAYTSQSTVSTPPGMSEGSRGTRDTSIPSNEGQLA